MPRLYTTLHGLCAIVTKQVLYDLSTDLLSYLFITDCQSVVMNRLDPIEELYDMYLEEEDTLRIIEIENDGLDLVSDAEGPADPYMNL